MNGKTNSLMERRKKNLQGLQSTIKKLSVVDNQLNVPKRELKQVHSMGDQPQKGEESEESKNSLTVKENRSRRGSCSNAPSSQDEGNKHFFDDKYTLETKIGQGAHGVVRRCIHNNTKKLYAVKVLQTQDEHFQSLKKNFINIRQLKHEAIIKYKALFIDPRKRICHTVMEYFPHSYLKPGLPQNDLRKVFEQLFDALTYLHKKHICHRDIKPENILFDPISKKVKIIDFGVSKNLKIRGRYQEMLTNTGTYYYKAPQMFLGAGYSEAVDSWAAGISLYELIVGATPFASVYHSETIENILNMKLDLDREQFAFYDPMVKDLITQLLKRNPKQRMTCEQAKRHLWFFGNMSNDLLRSAGYGKKKETRTDDKQLMTFLLKRKESMKQGSHFPKEVTKTDKKEMKTWLEMINEDVRSYNTEKVAIDFVQSQDEDQGFSFHLPKSETNFLKPKEAHHKNKSTFK